MTALNNKKLLNFGHCPFDHPCTLPCFIFQTNCCVFLTFLQDLQEFVDGSGDDGFIVFTLGSMVSNMPTEKAQQFVDAFRQIPQRVKKTNKSLY